MSKTVIRNKSDLEQAFAKARKYITKDDILEIFDRKYNDIQNVLTGIENNVVFPPLESLRFFECSFEDFVMRANKDELEKKLDEIFFELRSWRTFFNCTLQTMTNFIKVKETRDKKHQMFFTCFMVFFVIFSVTVIISAILPFHPRFENNQQIIKICSILVTLAGALDFVNGVAFGVREIINDRKNRKEIADVEQDLTGLRDGGAGLIDGDNNFVNTGKIQIKNNRF